MLKVTQVNFNKYESGNLLGFATVGFSLDGSEDTHITIKEIKLFKSTNGSTDYWVGLPSKKSEKGEVDENGKPKWYPTIIVTKSENNDGPGDNLIEHIRQEVVKAYKTGGSKKQSQPKQEKQENSNDDGVPF